MSYCRFSSSDWWSDIYAYESSSGFVVHVAGNRIVGDVPKCAHLFHPDTISEYTEAHDKQQEFLSSADREDIDLEHAGESFDFSTAAEAADFLCVLKDTGFRVPEYAIKALREESDEFSVELMGHPDSNNMEETVT